jgi:hypothetical protein
LLISHWDGENQLQKWGTIWKEQILERITGLVLDIQRESEIPVTYLRGGYETQLNICIWTLGKKVWKET